MGWRMRLNDYLKHPGVSSSDIRRFLKSPLHYEYRGFHRTSPAMLIGSATHAMVEGIFDDAYAVQPEGVDRRTKDGKLAYAQFQMDNEGKDILTQDQYEQVSGMANSALALLNQRFGSAPRENEPSLFWEEEGMQCKARPDILIDGMEPCVIELKTTQDASRESWYWKVKSFDYGIQAIHHLAGIENQRRVMLPYAWLVVENEPPYASVIHWMKPGNNFEMDEYRRLNALRSMKFCIDNRHFPSYKEDEIKW